MTQTTHNCDRPHLFRAESTHSSLSVTLSSTLSSVPELGSTGRKASEREAIYHNFIIRGKKLGKPRTEAHIATEKYPTNIGTIHH